MFESGEPQNFLIYNEFIVILRSNFSKELAFYIQKEFEETKSYKYSEKI